jgi:predicted porin
MKLAITGTTAFSILSLIPASAFAQSSVTLYGIIDEGIMYQNNQTALGSSAAGHSNIKVASGTWAGSRFGFKGKEDLGGGTSTIFNLEAGFTPNTGAQAVSGLLFNRQAYVGVTNTTYGTFTAGRQYTSYYQLLSPYSPTTWLTGALGAHPGDIDSLDTTFRANNALVYTSPQFAGFTFGGSYALGGVAGSVNSGSTWSLALQYLNGPFGIAAGVQRVNNSTPGGGTWGANSTANTAGEPGVSAVNVGYQTAAAQQRVAITGGYAFNQSWDVSASYSNVQYIPGVGSSFTDTAIFNTAGAVLHWRPTTPVDLAAGYSFTRATKANAITSAAQYQQFTLSGLYSLSKRTSLYALTSYQKANGKTLGASGRGSVIDATASIGDGFNSAPSATNAQVAATIGIIHRF